MVKYPPFFTCCHTGRHRSIELWPLDNVWPLLHGLYNPMRRALLLLEPRPVVPCFYGYALATMFFFKLVYIVGVDRGRRPIYRIQITGPANVATGYNEAL